MSIPNDLLSMIKNKNSKKAMSIIENGNLQDAVDKAKNTLLHYAAEYGNSRIVQFLIDCGSDVNAQNKDQQTALVKSLQSDLPCKQVIQILLEAGANIDKSAWTIVQSIEWLNKNSTFEMYGILKIFLERADDIIDFSVIRQGSEENIKFLLETKVDLSKEYGDRKQTLVHTLSMNLNPGVMALLRGRNFNVNVRDDDNCTPLMYAASRGNVNAVEFLLSKGADIDAQDKDKETALYAAINDELLNDYSTRKNKKVIQVLLEHGADVQLETVHGLTIFDLLFQDEDYESSELPLAHLALQKARGTIIHQRIRIAINGDHRLKSYFNHCRRKLSTKIYPSITLLDVLIASERKLERYLRDEKLASKLVDFKTKIDYFDTILGKRFEKARRIVELRKTAAQIVCKLIKIDYDSYPFVVDEMVSYLEEKDIQCLISIRSELS